MRWQQTEFLLKGTYLGLLLFLALSAPSWLDLALVGVCTLGGLVVCLGVAAFRKLREGYRVRGRAPAFLLFLVLENPMLVYAGVLVGLAVGVAGIQENRDRAWGEGAWKLMAATVGGGLGLGYLFWLLRHARAGSQRRWLSLALAGILVAVALGILLFEPELLAADQRQMLGAVLLLGLPGFYLLTFASVVEESEVEIAAMCAALGVGLFVLGEGRPTLQGLSLTLPAALYVGYTWYVLPKLRVFKHVLRGISYATVGQHRPALASFTRALQLDPGNHLAREQLWAVHRRLDLEQLAGDEETLALVSFELCLDRAASLLMAPPQPEQLQEAHRLLDLVCNHRPDLQPRCDYWRAVALLHERHYEGAAAALENVIAARTSAPDSAARRAVLLEAWQLALLLHPEMRQRVGEPQLAQPGRRMDAIAAVERRLAVQPEDAAAWDLKRLLYSDLTEEEYRQAVPEGAAADFDHTYAYQLGMTLLDDPARWQRGAAYLRMAARGLPANAPGLFVHVARAAEKHHDYRGAWEAYEQAKQAGRTVGPKNLTDEDRQLYFAVVKMLADSAKEDGNLDAAIENYNLYLQCERAGVATYRQLADLYERRGDAWSALRCTEQGLVYDAADADLLQRKDKYYYSVMPEELRQRWEAVKTWFDVDYCLRKARWLLDRGGADLDLLDWASHLLDLAQVARSDSFTVRLLRARVRRLRGETAEAIALLEEVHGKRPEVFPNKEEEDSWYLACRMLGDLYLEDRPDLAVQCLLEFRKSPKSGADTLYKLGMAYERLGDVGRAVKCYRQVIAFEQHPLAPDAHDALARLQAAPS
jgi:tetratricopeptide (TPR) repeat protein